MAVQSGIKVVLLLTLMKMSAADMWKDKVHLSCNSTGMRVELTGGPGGVPFKGIMWIEGSNDPSCAVRGTGKSSAVMFIPYGACNTHKASNSLFVNRVSFKQRIGLVSSRDSVVEVACRLKPGHVRVNSEKTIFSIITDGVMDISRHVAVPDAPQSQMANTLNAKQPATEAREPEGRIQPKVTLLRDNVSGKHRLMVNIRLPRPMDISSTSVRNCTVRQDNHFVVSTPDQRYPRRNYARRPTPNRVRNKGRFTNLC